MGNSFWGFLLGGVLVALGSCVYVNVLAYWATRGVLRAKREQDT